jgi:hypothetical protein
MFDTIVGLLGLVSYWLRKPLTKTQGTLQVPGLQAPVEIIRDKWGVPHIYAANSHDLTSVRSGVRARTGPPLADGFSATARRWTTIRSDGRGDRARRPLDTHTGV